MKRIAMFTAALAALLTSCGDSAAPASQSGQAQPTTTSGGAFPVTIGSGSSAATINARPVRIVSLSPTGTEMLFAIGAGKQVIAVDDQSNFPADAPRSDLSGFKPNVEAIAKKNPDLVVIQFDTNNLTSGLKALGVPVITHPPARTLADSYTQFEQLGAATGNVGGAAEAVLKMRTRIDEVAKTAKKPARPLRYYHEVDNTLYTATSSTFIGEIYKLAGLDNIADAADRDKSGFPQLSAEYLIQQDPDVVFLSNVKCCQETPAKFAARAGFANLKAVKSGAIIPVDDDLASRWGPRTPELFESIVKAVNSVPVPAR